MASIEAEDVARDVFEAYCETVGGVNFAGDPIPSWFELSDKIQQGWIAAAKHAYTEGYRDADSGPAKEPRFPLS